MKIFQIFAIAALALGFGAISGIAKADPMTMQLSDKAFIKQAATAGNDEIYLSKIAANKSDNVHVRKFARMMIMQHEQANAQLASIAMGMGVRVPTGPDFKHRMEAAELDVMTGKTFNKTYIGIMVKDHTKADHVFQMGASCNSSQLRSFAVQTLPVVENHLKMAQMMQMHMSASMASM